MRAPLQSFDADTLTKAAEILLPLTTECRIALLALLVKERYAPMTPTDMTQDLLCLMQECYLAGFIRAEKGNDTELLNWLMKEAEFARATHPPMKNSVEVPDWVKANEKI